jgi:hypothetical protein
MIRDMMDERDGIQSFRYEFTIRSCGSREEFRYVLM